MEHHPSQNLGQPEDFNDIEEVEELSAEEKPCINGGEISSWKPLDFTQRNAIRSFIAYTVIVVWILWSIAAIYRSVTGDNTLLICESALLFLPLKKVLSYYFDE